ncbi:MAG: succinate dehydrogenase/fumarate reductase iron-sulfur subunit [Thermodesulfobacteriota bacterium]|nr:MAG: succinate dehydrogenase/fumarate reductase iron-sulfur subunit [Thermodesulfobacteriota bacterium]
MEIKFSIRRHDPMDRESPGPYYREYVVDAAEGMTVLEALLKISEEEDPTLAFRRSCRSAICGSCAMTVNGFARLTCNLQVIPEYEKMGAMRIEPLANHRVVKDLVVDMAPFWEKMEKAAPFLMPAGGSETSPVTIEDQARIDESQRCIMCGCCNAECNSLEIDERFIAPAASAKAWRFVGDVREGHQAKRLERLSEEHGIWDCVRCIHCTQYCPKDVKPLKQIESLRSAAMKAGVLDNPGARHVEAMADSVERFGRLDEAAMTFKTLGFLRSLGMIPLGLKLERHGKMPRPYLFPQIMEIDEVRAIYDEIEKKSGLKPKKEE